MPTAKDLTRRAKKDPTARWSERVREMSTAVKNRSINYSKHKDNFDGDAACPGKVCARHFADTAKECISKRPLTSMVVAVTAGAAIAAVLAALTINGRRDR